MYTDYKEIYELFRDVKRYRVIGVTTLCGAYNGFGCRFRETVAVRPPRFLAPPISRCLAAPRTALIQGLVVIVVFWLGLVSKCTTVFRSCKYKQVTVPHGDLEAGVAYGVSGSDLGFRSCRLQVWICQSMKCSSSETVRPVGPPGQQQIREGATSETGLLLSYHNGYI